MRPEYGRTAAARGRFLQFFSQQAACDHTGYQNARISHGQISVTQYGRTLGQCGLGVQTDRILSDRIRIRIRKLDTDIRYPNIRADTDTDTNMVLNFNYPYPNSIYIPYSLIYIMKKIMYSPL